MSANIHPGFQTDNWCRTTQGETAKTTFTWTIDGFKNRPEKIGEFIVSGTFSVIGPDDKTTVWIVACYPKGKERVNEMEIYLRRNSVDIRAQVNLSIVNARKEKTKTLRSEISRFRAFGFVLYWTFEDHELDEILPDGNLSIFFEVTVYGPEKTMSGSKFPEEKVSRRDNCRRQVCEDFGTMLNDGDFYDFKIKCGDKSFKCHRNVLSARSPVFKAMLKSEMRENSSNKLTINDVEPEVISEMLHFIYTGSVINGFISEQVASDLLGTADKYQLDLLKNMCEDKLCSSLEISNSVQYLVLGELHHADNLRQMALRLIVKNMDLIVDSDVYKTLMLKHTDLALEITKALVRRAGTKRKLDENERV